ncbi:hypothetical protein EDB81DRAFT_695933 [Dactylonectria macrodidyma]|uniref:Zn(2)-C6 fungal-type domain-containing protein n=1 Tax=Dactylonectria macrodidyma TaxID=307937 RepID=A0A9P9ITL7_9HYPO|nr:hypothetical protein EDB81DRAFT_695933 [Dactylonectria macrodidyma]
MPASVIHKFHTHSTPAALGHSYPFPQQEGPPLVIGGYPPEADPPPSAYLPPDQRRGYYNDGRPPRPAHGRRVYATQVASGQRTPIACLFCRQRKIRCSGYQSAPGGECHNCVLRNQPCSFQSVSSSNSTAFVPVSAAPGGVPPGTQLFGAYDQPLASSSMPPPHPPQPEGRPPRVLLPLRNHYAPAQTPTKPFFPSEKARADGGSQVAGKRRRRTSEEPDEGRRLPPLRAVVDGTLAKGEWLQWSVGPGSARPEFQPTTTAG